MRRATVSPHHASEGERQAGPSLLARKLRQRPYALFGTGTPAFTTTSSMMPYCRASSALMK